MYLRIPARPRCSPLSPIRGVPVSVRRCIEGPSRALLVLALAVTFVGGVAAPSDASTPRFDDVVDLTYPVAGPSSFTNDYTACRGTNCERRHRATDIMAPYGASVHAAVGGVITFITGIDGPVPAYGYMITIAGDDGRSYSYIHLGRQDGTASQAYAPGMRRGVRVERGQYIGINGCSGNASCSAPHLHFEIEDKRVTDPYGTNRMNPYFSLVAARQRSDVAIRVPTIDACTGKAYALVGDWTGAGRSSQGWWCDGTTRLLLANGSVREFSYGRAGDVPIVGDWDGDGRDSVSVIRDGTWHLNNALQGGPAVRTFTYGRVTQGDVPVSGSWQRAGASMPGIIRDGDWHLRTAQSGGQANISFTYGRLTRGDRPLVGDWNGDGRDRPGIVRQGEWHLRNSLSGGAGDIVFTYGRVLDGDIPVVGDWNGDGRSTPGIVRDGRWHLRHRFAGGAADSVIPFPAP
jgi:murein DD-endopeptidase MepM/ murein hydrolase activator NlpD